MKLDKFILDNLDSILHEWEDFAKTIDTTTRHVSISDLQNDAKKMLIEISRDIVQIQSVLEQVAKSKGLSGVRSSIKIRPAWSHGFARLQQGFNISEVISEYRALRASVTKLWQAGSTPLKSSDFNEIVRFNEAIDQALSESIASYTEAQENQARLFASMLSSYPDLCYTLNLKGEFLYVNQAMIDLYKKPSHDILGTTMYHEVMPAAVDIHAHIQSILDTGERCHGYVDVQKPSGKDCFLEYVYAPIVDKNGQIEAVAAIEHDITIIKKTEQSHLMMSTALRLMNNAVIGVDLQKKIIIWNKGAENLYGYLMAEAIGQSIDMIVPKDRKGEVVDILVKLERGEDIVEYETRRIHKNGKSIPISLNVGPVFDTQGKCIGGVGVMRDITHQKEKEAQLEYIAEHDQLTGLINRVFFETRITQAIALAKRQKSNMAICFIDLDDFKNVNDVYGHAVGDLVLCAVTSRMKKYLRDMDTLARLGGDEFSLILMDVKNENDVITVVKKLMDSFANAFLIEDKHLLVTVSIGIALYPKDGNLSLVEKADAAMYYVKKHGKNNFKFYSDKMRI